MTKKPHKPQKTLEDRTAEAGKMANKLHDLGLSREHEGVAEVLDAIETWRVQGFSENKTIKLRGLKRVAAVQFSMRAGKENGLALMYAEHV